MQTGKDYAFSRHGQMAQSNYKRTMAIRAENGHGRRKM